MTQSTEIAPFRRYQSTLLYVYIVGFVAMLLFNINCYPGTFVGRVGWAAIWPLSLFGYLWEFGWQFENAILREGCFLLAEGAENVLP